jgi:hypothetical protein
MDWKDVRAVEHVERLVKTGSRRGAEPAWLIHPAGNGELALEQRCDVGGNTSSAVAGGGHVVRARFLASLMVVS